MTWIYKCCRSYLFLIVKSLHIQPFSFSQLETVGSFHHFIIPNQRTTSKQKAEWASTDDSWDRNGHKPPRLNCRVASECKSEESSNGKAHHGPLNSIVLGIAEHDFKLGHFSGELGGVIEWDEVFLVFFLLQGTLVRVVDEADICGKRALSRWHNYNY